MNNIINSDDEGALELPAPRTKAPELNPSQQNDAGDGDASDLLLGC
ncbi:MAG TPA: hypothetical protein VEH27_03315 [Methylomirabilota bacterium]|nr:hypothetical protein [Methylomirabilota bacterium]